MKFGYVNIRGCLIVFLALADISSGDDKKWVWNDNKRSFDPEVSSSNQNPASAGQIKLKLEDRPTLNKYSQRPQQGGAISSDQPYDYYDNVNDANSNKDYIKPNRPYRPGGFPQDGRYPVDSEQFPGQFQAGPQGGRFPYDENRFPVGARPFDYDAGRFPQPNRYPDDRFSPANPSKFSPGNAAFRPSRPFGPGIDGPYNGPLGGNIGAQGKCPCVPHYSCGPPSVPNGQCAPGRSFCCYGGSLGPQRRPLHHSLANGILAGPGGPVDPIPGQSQNSHQCTKPQHYHYNPPTNNAITNSQGHDTNYRPTAPVINCDNAHRHFTADVGQTNKQTNNNNGRFYYKIVAGPIYNRQYPKINPYKTIESSTIQKQQTQTVNNNVGGGIGTNLFRLFFNFIRVPNRGNGILGGPAGVSGPSLNPSLSILEDIFNIYFGYGYPGGNFIPGAFNKPYGGPYGSGPAGPYGNAYDNYARKAT